MTGKVMTFENPRARLLRGVLGTSLVLLVAGMLLMLFSDNRWTVLLTEAGIAFTCVSLWLQLRTRTLVSGSQVNVRRGFRDRVVLCSDVAEVTPGRRWSPVRLRLHSGETLELPHVPQEQAESVRQLVTGEELPS